MFLKCGRAGEQTREGGASTLEGGDGPCGPPRRYGAGVSHSPPRDSIIDILLYIIISPLMG